MEEETTEQKEVLVEEPIAGVTMVKNPNDGQKQIAGAIILAGIIIAGAVLLKDSRPPTNPSPIQGDPKTITAQVKPITSEDHIVGNKNAKIVIVEYSDLECPFCKVFHKTMQRVVADNKNVAWVYRHYPIPALHKKAFREAEATECAFDQGGNDAFWKYTDRIFEVTPANDGLADTELPKIAQFVGLNVEAFNTCLASGKFKNKIQASIDGGVEAGVNGTPSSFILVNGKTVNTIPGAQPYEAVMQVLRELE